jgi:branched-chain amino acid transport system permease protein
MPITALVIALLPLVFPGTYARSVLVVAAINVLLAIGLDIVIGYAGQLNLGQSAFFAIGAYVSTLLVTRAGVNFWMAFAAGTLGAAFAGAALALFAVRLRGHYLAIASMGFAIIVYQILMNWISLTQGPLGIYGIPPPPAWHIPGIGRIDFSDTRNFFWLVAAVALVAYLLLHNLVRSPAGEALIALREDEVSAASLGVNGRRWKVFAFAVAAAAAGMAGGFYASFVGTLVPDAFFITESFNILAMVIVGGAGTLLGPAAGAILLTVLPEVLRGIGDARLVVYGLALTLVVLFMPGGMAQAARLLVGRMRRPGAARR